MAGGEMCNWDKIEGLGVEESVRDEVIRGCELTRRLQTVLNSGQGPDMHQLMADFSAKIVATFSKALRLLNSGSAGWRGEERIGGVGVEDGRRSPTVLPSAKYRASDSPRSGARSHAGGSAPREKKFKWNNELAQRSKSFKEGVHRRKNLLPKLTVRISAYNCDPGNGMLPQDGHAWRKYGQKVIFGSHYPRSYYRCTHRNSMGCQATKQVQRAQDDPSVFEVTYIGFHTCEIDPRLHDIRLSPLVPQIGSQRDSTISSAFSFGSHCNPQSETCGTHGLTATRFISGSEPASSPWFGIDSGGGCEVENEDLGDFVKHSASTPFSYSFDFYNNPSHWGDPASNAMQPNTNYRPSELYASPYRDQGGEVQNSNGCTAMSEGAVGMQDFAGVFGSHEISDPTYSPLVPATPLMGSMEGVNSYGQHLQASEPELIEVVSGHTPADDSRMPNMDLIFNRLSPDSFLQFERVDPF